MTQAVAAIEWVFFAYFILINLGYFALNVLAAPALRRQVAFRPDADLPPAYSGLEPPVSLIVPAHNEEGTIVSSIRSLLQLEYPEFEIVIVNDGSTDGTLDALVKAFDLVAYPEAYWRGLPCKPVRGFYLSRNQPNVRVVDKENGRKADTMNAGINAARHPLFCAMDADSILERGSLRLAVAPFLDDPRAVAVGGTIRVANGCSVSGGNLHRVGLPGHPLALVQIVEYLRAFLFGRMGWSAIDALMIISGAFGVFRKDAVVEAGGYRPDAIGEDMELIVRIHRVMRTRHKPYAIHFVADPVCWTEAPENLASLRSQRIRWQRGLAESLHDNAALLKARGGGRPGLVAWPFFLLFECYGPILEVAGYIVMAVLWATGYLSLAGFGAFLALAVSLGFLLSMSALFLEEVAFHQYPRFSQLAVLVATAAAENLGFRQLVSYWRFEGLMRWVFRMPSTWDPVKRSGAWQK